MFPTLPKKLSKKELAERWAFPWPVMEVLIGGRSSVDLAGVEVEGEADATAFLRSYGFDPDIAKDRRKMHAILIEALFFVETNLMPKEWQRGLRPPKEVLLCDDPRKLLLWASDRNPLRKHKRLWSCAIIKVMHTIAHIDDLQRLSSLQEARQQIMGRFQKALFRDVAGHLWLGNEKRCLQLERVEWKHLKSRHSIILKLLHKPANVAETIYDLLGVRIVTRQLSDAMLVVKFLRQFYLADFPNNIPARARNTLIDVEEFKEQIEALRFKLMQGRISPSSFQKMVTQLKTPLKAKKAKAVNPHSSEDYHSIQLTCRQRVRYANPLLGWQEKLSRWLAGQNGSAEERRVLSSFLTYALSLQLAEEDAEISMFFPFEVQIMDRESADLIDKGEASHAVYKKAQVRTARRRILRDVLRLPSM